MFDGITLFHGGKRLNDRVEIRHPKAGRYECGPGFYATTHWTTAAKYARGGGKIHLISFSDRLLEPERWLETARLPAAEMLAFIKSLPRVPQRQDICSRISKEVDRLQTCDLPAYFLLNNMVNADACGNQNGVELAAFLTDNDILASLYSKNVDEQWVITFDPTAITSTKPVSSTELAKLNLFELPKVQDQITSRLQAIQAQQDLPPRESGG